jgi:hypothetical protein
MTTKTKSNPTESVESIKLGIDAHAKWYYVGRQAGASFPHTAFTTASPRPTQPHSIHRRIATAAEYRVYPASEVDSLHASASA